MDVILHFLLSIAHVLIQPLVLDSVLFGSFLLLLVPAVRNVKELFFFIQGMQALLRLARWYFSTHPKAGQEIAKLQAQLSRTRNKRLKRLKECRVDYHPSLEEQTVSEFEAAPEPATVQPVPTNMVAT